jgi:putative nucleotidyltransferase with HDIG domain
MTQLTTGGFMYEVEVKVSICKSGEILANNIVNEYGAILVGKNTILNEFIILNLKKLKIQTIWLYRAANKEEQEYNQANVREKFFYEGSILDTTTMIQNLSSGKGSKHETICHIIRPIYRNIVHRDYIRDYMQKLHNFDDYTYMHSINVAFYAMLIGKWLNMSDHKILDLVQAGLLHDIGKTGIEKRILNKKGELTDSEFSEIKQHCAIGYEMLNNMDIINPKIKKAVLFHHERLDGSGYPTAITSEYISYYAKIIAIADVYDAMTTDRIYKKKVTPFEVFHMFAVEGAAIYEASIVNVFLLNISSHLVGVTVLLDNGMTGEVVYIPPAEMDQPILRIMSSYQKIFYGRGPQITAILGTGDFDDSQ